MSGTERYHRPDSPVSGTPMQRSSRLWAEKKTFESRIKAAETEH